ncbi:MAG: hypothetical protein U1D55_06075 [Phycisphaerae bacterium]
MKSKLDPIEVPHPRIGATFALIPITFGVLLAAYLAETLLSSIFSLMPIFAITLSPPIVMVGGTLVIWGPSVRWTPRRRLKTIVLVGAYAAMLLLGCAVTIWSSYSSASFGFDEILLTAATLIFGLIGGGVLIILLNRCWWASAVERRATAEVRCPQCNYDLRGQTDCKCPECGYACTLGELAAIVKEK